jgi:NAD(P)-dependent dehydrogenase (short-subunit alcohol dehydrogenase family)
MPRKHGWIRGSPICIRSNPSLLVSNRRTLCKIAIPDGLASAVVFLASDESSFITGIDLPVDGRTASR